MSYRRLREWREIHNQLHILIKEFGFKPNEVPAAYDEIHRALLAGLLGNIGLKTEKDGEYLGARGIKFSIFPGSALKKAKPRLNGRYAPNWSRPVSCMAAVLRA